MIALNELLSNTEEFKQKYKLMGKRRKIKKIDKIISLTNDFSSLDKQTNNDRAICNKKCSEIAELVNKNKDTKPYIDEINALDKKIIENEKLLDKQYKSICRKLKRLPNLPLEDNILNLQMKSTCDKDYKLENFIHDIQDFAPIKEIHTTMRKYLKSQKDVILKEDDMPYYVRHRRKILAFFNTEPRQFFSDIEKILQQHSRFLLKKSIKSLKKKGCIGLFAVLGDGTNISVDLYKEYLSRRYNIKYKNTSEDMTRFANNLMIKIYYFKLKKH